MSKSELEKLLNTEKCDVTFCWMMAKHYWRSAAQHAETPHDASFLMKVAVAWENLAWAKEFTDKAKLKAYEEGKLLKRKD